MALTISSSATGVDVDQGYPGSAVITATLANVGDLVSILVFGGFTSSTYITSWATSGTGAVAGGMTGQRTYGTGFFGGDLELWTGVVTATGSTTFTATYTASIASQLTLYWLQQWTTGVPTIWSIGTLQVLNQAYGGGGTTVLYPSITPAVAGELYLGYVATNSAPSAGSTSGYLYSWDFNNGYWVSNPACSAGTQQPSLTQATTNDGYTSIGALITATAASSTVSPPYIVSQAIKRKASR
jgi:hypothetical protein